MTSPNLEILTFHWLCRNPTKLNKIGGHVFQNDFVKLCFNIVRDFHQEYAEIPFNLESPSASQILEWAEKYPDDIRKLDVARDFKENFEDFRLNANNIVEFPVSKYSEDWTDKAAKAYLIWRGFNLSLQKTIDFAATTKVSENNVLEVVDKAFTIFSGNYKLNLDDEIESIDFFNPEHHKRPESSLMIPTSWDIINKFLGGGFELGTTTLLWGGPNIGKSIWLGNIGLDIALQGYNVYIASLEMAAFKIAKRLGANLHNIDVNKYEDWVERDSGLLVKKAFSDFEDNRLNSLKMHGELTIERFSQATMIDIETRARRLAEEKGIEWHAIVIDYLGEVDSDAGFGLDKMYQKHKDNVAKMFAAGVRNNWAIISGHQLKTELAGVDDYNLDAASESKGISQRPDNIIGIIQTPTMKTDKAYYAKALKTRDNPYKHYKTRFEIDYTKMRLTPTQELIPPDEMVMV